MSFVREPQVDSHHKRASEADRVCNIWWRHHVYLNFRLLMDTPFAWYLSLSRNTALFPRLNSFHIYTSYQATSECMSRVQFLAKCHYLKILQLFLICNFDFVLFWQAPKPVGWMMCFLLMIFVPVQKLCVYNYIYIYALLYEFCFFGFTNCVMLSDDNSLITGCLWILAFVLNNTLILGIWCSSISHLPGCFCPWTFL